MRHFTNAKFWAAYQALPIRIQRLADKNFQLMKADPRHPSIQLKKVGRFWSARVGDDYRTVAVEYDGGLLWFWIGGHAEYDNLIK
ncbi:MAG: hypothetical protein ACLPX9_02950 [Rhodomicrobium sp.]